jgi:hypothetical protein
LMLGRIVWPTDGSWITVASDQDANWQVEAGPSHQK